MGRKGIGNAPWMSGQKKKVSLHQLSPSSGTRSCTQWGGQEVRATRLMLMGLKAWRSGSIFHSVPVPKLNALPTPIPNTRAVISSGSQIDVFELSFLQGQFLPLLPPGEASLQRRCSLPNSTLCHFALASMPLGAAKLCSLLIQQGCSSALCR